MYPRITSIAASLFMDPQLSTFSSTCPKFTIEILFQSQHSYKYRKFTLSELLLSLVKIMHGYK